MTIILIMMTSGLIMLILNQKHTLSILLTFEFILLSSLLLIANLIKMYSLSPLMVLTFLTMIACEGAMGLSLITTLVRFSGNDYITSMMKF